MIIAALLIIGFVASVIAGIHKTMIDVKNKKSFSFAIFKFSGFLLMMLGLLGLLERLFISNSFGKHIPDNFEFPIERRATALLDANGKAYIPLESKSRIQVYDKNAKFQRGWHYETFGGKTKLWLIGDTVIRVATAREAKLFFYDTHGVLLKTEDYAPLSFSSFVEQSYVPFNYDTPLILLPFSTVLGNLGVVLLGMIMVNLADNIAKKFSKCVQANQK